MWYCQIKKAIREETMAKYTKKTKHNRVFMFNEKVNRTRCPSRIGYECAIVEVIPCGYPSTMPVYKMWTSLAQRFSLSGNRKGLPLQWHKRYSMVQEDNDALSTDVAFPEAERINAFPTNKKIKKIRRIL